MVGLRPWTRGDRVARQHQAFKRPRVQGRRRPRLVEETAAIVDALADRTEGSPPANKILAPSAGLIDDLRDTLSGRST